MSQVKLLIAGDFLPMPCNYDLFSKGDTKTLFGDRLCSLFASADCRVCNLEGCFTDSDSPIEKTGPNIKAPTSTIKAVKNLGIDYATLGNTHSMDYGKQGYLDTCKTLSDNGIGYFGWGDSASEIKSYQELSINGFKITLYNVTERFDNAPGDDCPGVNLYDEYRVCRELNELKKRCDYLIVFYHGGIEGTRYNSEIMRRRFHRMADNGADIVISQHTHAIGEEEYCNGAYFLYGQGNFCFHFRNDVTPLLGEGLVLEADFTKDGFTVKPHRVLRTERGCVYDEAQDLSGFYERSKKHSELLAGDKAAKAEFERNFGNDAKNWLLQFLLTFRGIDPVVAEKRKVLSPEELRDYLLSLYPRQYLNAILTFLRNEEFNEIGQQILSDLLRKTE